METQWNIRKIKSLPSCWPLGHQSRLCRWFLINCSVSDEDKQLFGRQRPVTRLLYSSITFEHEYTTLWRHISGTVIADAVDVQYSLAQYVNVRNLVTSQYRSQH